MRQLIVFLGILALVVGTGGMAKVYANNYGTNITIYDNAPVSPATGTGIGKGNEDNETEPHTYPGQWWDLEAFKQNGKTLSIIGGFNFATGQTYEPGNNTTYREPVGALFFKTSSPPIYGGVNPDLAPGASVLNSLWGYNYAITFAVTKDINGKVTGFATDINGNYYYTLWKATAGSELIVKDIMHGPDGGDPGDVSNPYTIGCNWVPVGTHTFTYTINQSDSDVGGDLTLWDLKGTHNVISGIDLSFLADDFGGVNPITYLHLTYLCGNDNLMGRVDAKTVPLPPSALLLGTGLLGLVGLRRFRKS